MGLILGVFRLVPPWVWLVVALVGWGGYQRYRANSAAAVYQQAQIEAAKATEAALAENIRETARRLAEQVKATEDAQAKTTKARADAGAAGAAAARLRERLDALRAASAPAGNPPAAAASGAAGPADLLAACADRYSSVAASADRAVIAGQACEAHYRALIVNPPQGKP